MPREVRPRCGKWMPKAQDYCGLAEGHPPRCLSVKATLKMRRKNTADNRQRASERYRMIDEYKLARGCERCGYRESAIALDLDHIDPSQKVANVSYLAKSRTREAVLTELEKCRVLCANCHRIKTHREGESNSRRTPEAAATG